MYIITVIVLVFAALGALDRMLGNRFGLGEEFERAFMLLGVMALSMIGMIVISPVIADIMRPVFTGIYNTLHIDPSVVPAMLFANDMGGASLAAEVAVDSKIGMFNALVVSSMMGCTVSFTIPFAMGMVRKEQHSELLMGILCGTVTIPVGCFVSGLVCRLPMGALLIDLLPLVIFSGIIAVGLMLFPEKCVKIFRVLGIFIKILITAGLYLGMVKFLTGREIVPGMATMEEGAIICVNAAIVLSGAFPLVHIISKILKKPLDVFGDKVGINGVSAVSLVASLATSATAFGMMEKMDPKGVMLNSAFAVSGAFVFAAHLAFTMAFNGEYILPVIVGKLISGILAVIFASFIYEKAKTA